MNIGTRLSRLLEKLSARPVRRRGGRGLAQRGMTLLEIMIVLAILALVMGLIVGPRVMAMFSKSKVDLTRLKVKKFSDDAFTQWSMTGGNKGCPSKLGDLTPFMNDQSPEAINDAWNQPLKMLCGSSLPPGAMGLAVMSIGPDGKEGTEDDIKSWQ